jgi:predicted Zn-dependent protease
MRGYFPADTRRAISLGGLIQGRQLLFSQALEADADRAAVDLAARAGVGVDGLIADFVVGAMIDGLRPQPVGSHPPGLYRFDDARARLRRWGLSSFADKLTRRDLARAMREARVAGR